MSFNLGAETAALAAAHEPGRNNLISIAELAINRESFLNYFVVTPTRLPDNGGLGYINSSHDDQVHVSISKPTSLPALNE